MGAALEGGFEQLGTAPATAQLDPASTVNKLWRGDYMKELHTERAYLADFRITAQHRNQLCNLNELRAALLDQAFA